MQRLLSSLLLAGLCLGTGAASAQDIDSEIHDGAWTARVQIGEKGQLSARVVIANFGGTWQDVPVKGGAANKACRGKRFPITVQRSRQSEMQFTVWGSAGG